MSKLGLESRKHKAATFRAIVRKLGALLGFAAWLILPGYAQLLVTPSQAKIQGQKIVVPLMLKNEFDKDIQSARASVFVLDPSGKLVCQGSKWIIGGTPDKPGLRPAETNMFNFVVSAEKPFAITNLSIKVSVNKLLLQGGHPVDPNRNVRIRNASSP